MTNIDETKRKIDEMSTLSSSEVDEYLRNNAKTAGNIATNLQASESKEIAKKSLEFEEDTFKIDSSGWGEETRTVNGKDSLVKVSPAGDVLEYINGPAKGEQLFINYDHYIKYVAKAKGCSIQEAEQTYLLTEEELQTKMKQVDYEDFYDTHIKGHLAGHWHPSYKECLNVGERYDMWLAGGDHAAFHQYHSHINDDFTLCGFSGRLLNN